jgi:ABC-2 type transport system permease protein
MNKTLLIFKHEFLHTITRTGFIVLTLALPVLALLGIGIFYIISGVARPAVEVIKIGYVDQAGSFDQFTSQGNITLIPQDSLESATQALIKNDIKEYFVIPSDYASTGKISVYTLEKQVIPPQEIQTAIKSFLVNNLLTKTVPEATIKVIESPLNLITIRLETSGAVSQDQGGVANIFIPIVFGILLMLSLIFSSTYVLQGLSEEKENRLMEILLSSVSTRELITGKVLGIGAAGLAQVVFWVILLPFLVNMASSSIGGFISTLRIPPSFLLLGVVYFILGYFLFAMLSAGIAAISTSVREGQGIASMFTLFAIAPFWFFSFLLNFPNSPVWVVFSIFPFSSPVLVMLRLGMTGVPVWQIVASICVLILSIIGGLLLTAKLLRTYMLMYGKRPGLSKIIRNLKS